MAPAPGASTFVSLHTDSSIKLWGWAKAPPSPAAPAGFAGAASAGFTPAAAGAPGAPPMGGAFGQAPVPSMGMGTVSMGQPQTPGFGVPPAGAGWGMH